MQSRRTFVLGALLVFLGGALGSGLRIAVQSGVTSPHIALGVINIVGSFAIGLVAGLKLAKPHANRAFLITGVLGGFTTYSACTYLVFQDALAGNWWQAAAFAVVSVAGGLAAAIMGERISHA